MFVRECGVVDWKLVGWFGVGWFNLLVWVCRFAWLLGGLLDCAVI